MIYNNLNRVKGILSAQLSALIPKFNTAGKIYTKLLSSGPIYSLDGQRWFTDDKFLPYTDTSSMEFLLAALQEIIPEESSIIGPSIDLNKNTVTIPGKNYNEGKPNAAAENAAKLNEIFRLVEDEMLAERRAAAVPVSDVNVTAKNPNTPSTVSLLNVQPLDKTLSTEEISAGMQTVQENLKKIDELNLKVLKQTQNWQRAGLVLGAGILAIGGAMGAQQSATDSNLTKGVDSGVDAVGGMLSQMGGIAGGIGLILQIGSAAGQIIEGITGGTDQMTAADKFFDSGIGTVLGGWVNQLWGKNSDAFGIDLSMAETVGSSYGGSMDLLNEAARTADKKYGLFSSKARKKANENIAAMKATQNLMSNIANTATDQRLAVQSMGEQAGLAYSMMTDGGYNLKYTYAAKHGGLLEWNPVVELDWQPQVELNWELPTLKEGGSIDFVEELEWIPEFKDGGKTEESDVPETEETNQKNVIPEGALHKNKHHMEHAEGLTKKGIPVVDEDGEQQAEIEHSEIIFTLEVTKKLEEYYEIFYSEESTNKEKEQAALNAGKLLVYQILENTEDRTGLIESCKKGGSLTLKKSTDELIEEVLEWMPTIVIVETEEYKEEKHSKKEDQSEAKNELSEKDKMKEAIREVLIELLVK